MPPLEEIASKQLHPKKSNEYANQLNISKRSNSLEYISLQDKGPFGNDHHEGGEYIDHHDLHNQPTSSTAYLELEEASQTDHSNVNSQIEEYYSRINYASIRHKETQRKRLIALAVIVALLIAVLLLGAFINRKRTTDSSSLLYNEESVLSLSRKHCTADTETSTRNACRADFVRNMTREAFGLYRQFAWGAEGLAPVAGQPTFGRYLQYPGVSIVAAMSTFAAMDLQEELAIGEEWITTKMNVSECTRQMRPKDVVTEYIGGLLSAYAIGGGKKAVFLERAREFLQGLEPATNPSTGMLIYLYDSRTRVVRDHSWNKIASVGFQQTELIFLANLTADLQLMDRLANVRKLMTNITTTTTVDGHHHRLPPSQVNVTTGEAIFDTVPILFEDNIDFFYDMLRSYIQRGRQDRSLLQLYTEAVNRTLQAEMFKLMPNGLLYVREYDSKSGRHSFGMSHLACQLGAMLAIGARELRAVNKNATADQHLQLAVNITETCYQTANGTKTQLLPGTFMQNVTINANGLLTPELAEAYFILWRLTGDTKYQERAWELTLAVYAHCRTANGGYTDHPDVNSLTAERNDFQGKHILAGLFKYLYLTFSSPDTSLLPLDRWIFTSQAQPLPICGTNGLDLYSRELCSAEPTTFCSEEKWPSKSERLACRRSFVRNMTREAFSVYRKYAWGAPAVKPNFRVPAYGVNFLFPGATIVGAMSTLWTMGLRREWRAGRQWITKQLHSAAFTENVRTVDLVTNYLGGLLSAYFLSGEEVFLNRSLELMYGVLEPAAFSPSTGMLVRQFVPRTGQTSPNDTTNYISFIGFQQPELILLANLTTDKSRSQKIAKRLLQVRRLLVEKSWQSNSSGLFLDQLNLTSGEPVGSEVSLDNAAYLYNALNSYIQLGRGDGALLQLYTDAVNASLRAGMFRLVASGSENNSTNTMVVLSLDAATGKEAKVGMTDFHCQLGGMLALGARELLLVNSSIYRMHLQLAVELAETCYQEAMATRTGLMPQHFWLKDPRVAARGVLDSHLPESYLILWRLTGEEKYRERAWELTMAFYRHSRTASGGYSDVANVNVVPTVKLDIQWEFFFSGTLKYLYLINEDESGAQKLPLTEWFFNERGHPLPICGKHRLYPEKMCLQV